MINLPVLKNVCCRVIALSAENGVIKTDALLTYLLENHHSPGYHAVVCCLSCSVYIQFATAFADGVHVKNEVEKNHFVPFHEQGRCLQ